MQMVCVLPQGHNPAMMCTMPMNGVSLIVKAATSKKNGEVSTDHSSLSLRHLKDCPQRSVVSMQSSVRLNGSLRHSGNLRAPMAELWVR